MAKGKQAKILSKRDEQAILDLITHYRYPLRGKVLFLLSAKAGLRAKEISGLTWSMVCDGAGMVSDCIELPDSASKGKGGRTIPLNAELRTSLEKLRVGSARADGPVIPSERGGHMSSGSICTWFERIYSRANLEGCSSHSGRRTFITRAARKVSQVGGSIRDVQQLAGHSNLATTQIYIEGHSEAKRKLVDLI